MAEVLKLPDATDRETIYIALLPQIKTLIAEEEDLIANLANITAVLHQAFGFFWVGFYRRVDDQLRLGPFQGTVACSRIHLSQGVCGASASQKQTIIVPDVDLFPGHIACSSASRSEIVVPLSYEGEVKLVLDIDSDKIDDFSTIDAHYLQQIIELISQQHFDAVKDNDLKKKWL